MGDQDQSSHGPMNYNCLNRLLCQKLHFIIVASNGAPPVNRHECVNCRPIGTEYLRPSPALNDERHSPEAVIRYLERVYAMQGEHVLKAMYEATARVPPSNGSDLAKPQANFLAQGILTLLRARRPGPPLLTSNLSQQIRTW